MELISRDNPVFSAYAFYTGVLVIKMLLMSLLTAKQRMSKKVFANPEDAKLRGAKVIYNDPDVERVRRAHLNDLENIPVFIFISFLYVLTSPAPGLALLLFRVYAAARILHTVVYAVCPLPQPARGLAFGAGLGITIYMTVQVLTFFI